MQMSDSDDMVTHKAEFFFFLNRLLVTFAKLPEALPHLYV